MTIQETPEYCQRFTGGCVRYATTHTSTEQPFRVAALSDR